MRKALLFLSLTFIACSTLFAQENAISISNFTVKNSLPQDVKSWTLVPASLLLVAQNNTWGDRAVKLFISIKRGDTKVCGNADGISLDYFKTRSFQTNDLIAGLGNCETLQPGDYTLCVFFKGLDDKGQWASISPEICKPFNVTGGSSGSQNYMRPSIISPENGKVFTEKEANAPITFRWTPVVPKPQEPVKYHLSIWQLPEGQNALQVIKGTQPVVQKDVENLSQASITSGLWPCRPYCPFIWFVKATNKEGAPFGDNNGESEIGSFIISGPKIKDSISCCNNSKWLNKYYGISAPLIKTRPIPIECGQQYVIDYVANGTISFNADYVCNPANDKCAKQVFVKVKNTSGNVLAYQSVPYGIPLINAGNYSITYYAMCGDRICDSCEYSIIINQDNQKYCCNGGYWLNKSIDWSNIVSNRPIADSIINSIPPTSINITTCNVAYHIGEVGTYTFKASYYCGLSNCSSSVKVKIKGLTSSSLDGIYTAPVTKTFTAGGSYLVTYYAYCGDNLCDSCSFTVGVDQNCCAGSRWIKANYQIVNKMPDGSWVFEPGIFSLLGNTPPLKADLGIDISNLNYQCAANCTTGYIVRRMNLAAHTLAYPDETLPSGQTTTSIYSKPFPQLVTITPMCGGQACGNPISFTVECLHKDCIPTVCSNDSLVFSTGINLTGGPLTNGQLDPYWTSPYGLSVLSAGISPFFGLAGYAGAGTELQNLHYVPPIQFYTAQRDFYVCNNGTINFSGKLGISQDDKDTWAELFHSFKIYKAGIPVWTFVPGTPGTVGTYVTNDFNGSLSVSPGKYTFVFEYSWAGRFWNYNSMFVAGLITGNVLANNKECCPLILTSTEPNNPIKENSQKLTKADAGRQIYTNAKGNEETFIETKLTDLNRPLSNTDKVNFLEDIKMQISGTKNPTPKKFISIYKIEENDKGDLFGIPVPFIGITVPYDILPWQEDALTCQVPCAGSGAGICGSCFQFHTIEADKCSLEPLPEEDIYFCPSPRRVINPGHVHYFGDDSTSQSSARNSAGSNSSKSETSYVGFIKETFKGEYVLTEVSGTFKSNSKPSNGSSWHSVVVKGYGTIAFEVENGQNNDSFNVRINRWYAEAHPPASTGENNPIDQINGGPRIYHSVIACTCSAGYGDICNEDAGVICSCAWGVTESTRGSIDIPTIELGKIPVGTYHITPMDGNSLVGRSLIIKEDIKLDKTVADSLGCEEVFLRAGEYKYTENNSVTIPLRIIIMPDNPLYHSINEKGTSGVRQCKAGEHEEIGWDGKTVMCVANKN